MLIFQVPCFRDNDHNHLTLSRNSQLSHVTDAFQGSCEEEGENVWTSERQVEKSFQPYSFHTEEEDDLLPSRCVC